MSRDNQTQSGMAFVEFAIVAAFVLFIAMAGLEMAHSFRLLETATTFSREIASAGYRSCAGSVPTDHPGSSFNFYNECLAEAVTSIQGGLNESLPGAEVVLSLYEYMPPAGGIGTGKFKRRGMFLSGTLESKFQPSLDSRSVSGDIDNALIRSQQWFIVSELYAPYGHQSPLLNIFRPDYFYDVTFI